MAEILLNLDKITFQYTTRLLFNDLNFEVQDGQRIGFVGLNGVGKSTLMKIMAGELQQDSGNIYKVSKLTMGRLEQEPELDSGRTLLEEAMTARPEIAELEQQMRQLEGQMADPAVYEDEHKLAQVMADYDQLTEKFDQMDGARYTNSVEAALLAVGLVEEHWQKPASVLSGGQKKLVILAKLIVQKPRLLLLDEPDNHLDVPAKRDLEKLLSKYPGAVVMISHDRYLLDETVTHIAELENGKIEMYKGNYTEYAAEREHRRLKQMQAYAAQQKEIAALEEALKRFELWAKQYDDERFARKARHRKKMLDRMDRVGKVVDARDMGLELGGYRGSKKAIQLQELGMELPNGNPLWYGLDTTIYHGERVGVVGPNGVGKSMLFKTIRFGERDGFSLVGQIKVGPSTHIGYYAQEQDTLNYNNTMIQELRATAPISEDVAVSILHNYLFTYEQSRSQIKTLSGGEKSRLQLAKLVLGKPNLLLLDEPTNNLDIGSIEVLEEALAEFIGTVVVISHDRYFLDRVVDRTVEIREGELTEYAGGYTDYLEKSGYADV
ncbi:MAG: ABC-F family ATP-binding cassette domain-containing protein [Chloroflexota bacterium]